MKNILIIKCGESLPQIKSQFGDFEDWIIKISGLPVENFKVINLPTGDQLRHPEDFAATIITGSQHNTNQRFPWIKKLKDWITTAMYSNSPVLGIGFGFQIIAEVLGGKVNQNTDGLFLGTSFIHLTPKGINDPLFRNTGDSFESYLNHNRYVSFIPPEVEILAKNTAGKIMAICSNTIYGIQFHPELPENVFKMYIKSSSLPVSAYLGVKLRSEYKNRSIIPNFFNHYLNY
jgi:GMP synthase (glutamine-hydrolysing)